MMTYTELLEGYGATAAAHVYALGFTLDRHLYVVRMSYSELVRYTKPDRMSSKRGGWAKVRVRLSADERRALVERAELLGGAELLLLDADHNRGENLERELTERWLHKSWVKDSVPYWVRGDLRVAGVEVQVKLDGAELTNERAVARAFRELGLA